MPSYPDQIMGLIKQLVASGRTRLLCSIAGIAGLVAGIYFDGTRCWLYAPAIVVIVVVFIVCKTIQDIKEK